MGKTKIEWCDLTWNPLEGCTKVSPGCVNCWAEKTHKRLAGFKHEASLFSNWKGSIYFNKKVLPEVLKVQNKKIFVVSRSDIFHKHVLLPSRNLIFATMFKNPTNQYLCLTKRPEIMLEVYQSFSNYSDLLFEAANTYYEDNLDKIDYSCIWQGISVENQQCLETRIHYLIRLKKLIPSITTWLSVEPLLDKVDLSDYLQYIDWIVVGGENGKRECKIEWIEQVVTQAFNANLPIYVKQVGTVTGQNLNMDNRGEDFDKFPLTIQYRQYPQIKSLKSKQLSLFDF